MSEPESTPKEKVKKVRLARAEQFVLDTWVNAHREELIKGEYSLATIVDLLKADVNPGLNKDHVSYTIRQFDIKMKTAKRTPKDRSTHNRKIRFAMVGQLALIVNALKFEGFNLEFDPLLQEIINKGNVQ